MTDLATLPRELELTLPVVETFHSLQGEGLHAGRSAFFIRLAGCNVGCPWCDTKPSWELEAHLRRSLAELAEEVAAAAAAGAAFAVVTGGEPLEHDLGPLCEALESAGLPLHLETSGAAPLPLSGRFAWITLSPKWHRPPSPALLAACDELKVVVHEPADLAFAEAMAAQAIVARVPRADGCEPHLAGANDRTTSAAGNRLVLGEAMSQAVSARPPAASQDRASDQRVPVAAGGPDLGEGATPSVAEPDTAPIAAFSLVPASDGQAGVSGGSLASSAPPDQPTRPGPALLLQPGWNCRRGQELAVEFVRSHPDWRLSLQSHKWLGVR